VNTCEHRSTTFSRDICPDPCGVMHTYCDDCDGMVDRCAHGYVDNPAAWTREQAQAAQAELDELERTDPDVAAAAASYDRMVERVTGRTIPTPAERAAAEELTRELDTVYGGGIPQATPDDFAKAHDLVKGVLFGTTPGGQSINAVAQALAAERAAIHARYEAVAARLMTAAHQHMRTADSLDEESETGQLLSASEAATGHAKSVAARYIRQVAAK